MSATPADQIDASNQPEMVDGFWTDRRWALLETLLVLAVFACHGACLPPDINEPHYLAKAKHFWNPAWCPLDFFLNSADAHQVFYVTFGWLTLWLPLPAVAWVGRIITWAVQAWGWRRLSVAIIPRPGMAVLSAALLVMLSGRLHMSGEWIIGGLEAKGVAYGLVFWGLEQIARGQWNAAWVILGAASAFHVLVGGWTVIIALAAWLLYFRNQATFRSMLPWLCLGGLLSLPGLAPGLLLNRGTPAEVIQKANYIYVYERLGHHLVYDRFVAEHILRFLAMIGVWLVLMQVMRRDPFCNRLNRCTLMACLVYAGGIALSVRAAHSPAETAGLLRYYWFRPVDAMLPISASLTLLAWLEQLLRRPARKRLAQGLLAVASILAALHLADVRWWHYQSGESPSDFSFTVNLPAWKEACVWAAEHTPADAVFLTPRMSHTFRWYAGRAEVTNRKDIPQDAASIVEWWQRQLDVFYTEDAATDSGGYWNNSLAQVGEERILFVGKKYGADYLITDAMPPLSLERVGPISEWYAIYRLPSVREEKDNRSSR